MATKEKAKPAVLSFLEELKSAGITTVNEASVRQQNAEHSPALPESGKAERKPYLVKNLNTEDVKPWKLANRLVINESNAAELVESIKLNGQRVPAIVRPSETGRGYELICGARRLYACKKLGIELLAAVVQLDDQEAALVMDLENREREDISPYERGRDYKHWVEEGIYKNYSEICTATGIKKSLLSQLVALAELDAQIISAFPSPADLSLKWGYELHRLAKSNPQIKHAMAKKAHELKDHKLSAKHIYASLKAVTKSEKAASKDEVIKDQRGNTLAKVSTRGQGNVVVEFSKHADKQLLEQILSLVRQTGKV